VRITLAALAYVLGGVDYLYNAAYDEVLGTPTEDSAKIALRTQQILAYELGITNTADPLGGSYFIESLTTRIEKQIHDEFLKVQDMGGAITAIENGYYRSVIGDGAIRRQREFESGERISVGVNKFRTESSIPSGAFRGDPEAEARQVERLKQLKKQRKHAAVRDTLEYLREVASGEGNVVPAVLEAVRAYATIGEICDVFRQVFGEYRSMQYFSANR
jgi:methylmalonyl-CoA mutase N-terminal domain/subunit